MGVMKIDAHGGSDREAPGTWTCWASGQTEDSSGEPWSWRVSGPDTGGGTPNWLLLEAVSARRSIQHEKQRDREEMETETENKYDLFERGVGLKGITDESETADGQRPEAPERHQRDGSLRTLSVARRVCSRPGRRATRIISHQCTKEAPADGWCITTYVGSAGLLYKYVWTGSM